MKTKLRSLEARWRETDRSALDGFMRSLKQEREAATQMPGPLALIPHSRHDSYVRRLLETQNLLQASSSLLVDSSVTLELELETWPVMALYSQKAILPPAAVRVRALEAQFALVRLSGRLLVSHDLEVTAALLALTLDPKARPGLRRATVQSLFPKRDWRTAGTRFGLRPNLTFWTPGRAQAGESVRPQLLMGPRQHSAKSLGVAGAGAGGSRMDWYLTRRSSDVATDFECWSVLSVPGKQRAVVVDAALAVEITTPAGLAGIWGERRFLRDRRQMDWPFPAPVRMPSRSD